MSCAICEVRKEKRFCPAVHGRICPQCCGEQREVTLDCPSDCPYLQQAREHEKPRPADEPEREILTPREREIVQLLAEGKSTKEVAVALGLSVKTAETHRSNIMRKLNLHSISELVLYAVRNNIVQVVQPPAEKQTV